MLSPIIGKEKVGCIVPLADVSNLQSSSILVSVFLFSFVLGKLNMSKD